MPVAKEMNTKQEPNEKSLFSDSDSETKEEKKPLKKRHAHSLSSPSYSVSDIEDPEDKSDLKGRDSHSPGKRRDLRSSKRASSSRNDQKENALNEIKARREKSSRKNRNSPQTYLPQEEEEEEEDTKHSNDETKTNEWVEDLDELNEELKNTEEDEQEDRNLVSSAEELNKIRVSRDTLEKYANEPFFDKLLVGFFVRVCLGTSGDKPVYRIAEIEQIFDGPRKYKLGHTETFKVFKLRYANHCKVFTMETVSNHDFTQSEFEKWISDVRAQSQHIISQRKVESKAKSLRLSLENYIYTPKVIEEMLEQKSKLQHRHRNLAFERAKLITRRDVERDPEELQKICDQIDDIDRQLDARKTLTPKISITDINKRNREANIDTLQSSTKLFTDNEKTENVFKRRPTKPTAHMIAKVTQETIPTEEKSATPILQTENKKETETKESAHNEDVATSLIKAHDFDIDIDVGSSSGWILGAQACA
eukprot:TRINITY_DN1951_c0_g1_i1.p1 TRINITY_DN1951_c0_g1~~TRINITY_DN1951_c0_g1_i1.p1  ORF type:complete len:478 (+),score=108.68 TRINITY_DN1951_c0_g1_i1:66-1499(+)